MPATIPPWLDINGPQNVLKAAQVGSEMGGKQVELQLEGQRIAAQQQESQARVAQAAQAHQLATDELQLETQKAQVTAQEAKMKMSMEWQEAGKKFQAQQQYQQMYQNLISQGLDPNTAAIQATMAVGVSGGGTAGMLRAAEMGNGMAQVPAGVGARGGATSRAALPTTKLDPFDDAQLKTDQDLLKEVEKDASEAVKNGTIKQPGVAQSLKDRRDRINADIAKLRTKYHPDASAPASSPFQDPTRPVGNFSPNPDFQARPTTPGAGGGANPQDPLGLGIAGKGTPAAPPDGASTPTAAPDAQIPSGLQTGIPSIDKAAQGQLQAAAEQKQQAAEAAKQQKIKDVTQQIGSTQKEIDAIVERQRIEDMSQSERDSYYEKSAASGSLPSAQTGGSPIERAQRVKAAQTKLAQLNQMLSQLTSQ